MTWTDLEIQALTQLAANTEEKRARMVEMEELLRGWLANHVGALAASELYELAKRTSEIVSKEVKP